MQIAIKDETASGKTFDVMSLIFNTKFITVRDVITERVTQEVAIYNRKLSGVFNGLVQPTHAEASLNGYKMKAATPIDANKQIDTAIEAFSRNRYFILVDDKQADSLDDEIVLAATTVISFVKLTPLVGG
jgi:glutaredoxin 2